MVYGWTDYSFIFVLGSDFSDPGINQISRKSRYTVSSVAGIVAAPYSQTQATLDGTTDTGANSSSAQRRVRALPLPHFDNGVRQSRVNADRFDHRAMKNG
ncbi:hypothetical protein AHAS_Ahas15G0262600 [Arachis hypogaea]